jgi:hypothetical protein
MEYGAFAAVVVVMGALYAALFMVARMLENQKLEAVAKSEMLETLIGGFIVVLLIYAIFTVGQSVGYATIKSFVPNSADYVGSVAPSSDSFFFEKANATQDRIISAYTSIFVSTSGLAGDAAAASMAYLSRGIQGTYETGGSASEKSGEGGKEGGDQKVSGGSTGTLVTYLCRPISLIAGIVNELASLASRTVTIMFAQKMLVNYAGSIYMPLFFIGIILRSFNIVRGIGAFFIGFSIALYLYPVFLILMEGYTIEHFASRGLDLLDAASVTALNSNINAVGGFDRYSGMPLIERRDISGYCDENPKNDIQDDISAYQAQLDSGISAPDIGSGAGGNITNMGSLMFAMLLAQGFALLMVVSLTGGIAKVMGSDISPFVIGQITRIGAMRWRKIT